MLRCLELHIFLQQRGRNVQTCWKPVPELIECGISKPVPELIDFIPVQRRINSPELRLTLGKRIDTDDASNHGGADIKSNFDLQDILLKMDSHSVPFKYEKNVRISYITAHQSVAQGSFVIEPVMVLLTYLTRVQDAMQVRGDIGEIGVHHGKFFVGLGHLQKVNEKLWACDVFENQKKNTDGSGFVTSRICIERTTGNGTIHRTFHQYESS
ncbi:unnamed protein product [Bathycoccus prasinos]